MDEGRYVVLGLAHARSPWFSGVARLATDGALPLEFVKCLSVEEVRARLTSGRRFSALLVDGRHPGLDRDLIASAAAEGCTPFVVVDDPARNSGRDWLSLGAAALIPAAVRREELLAALTQHAAVVPRADAASKRAAPAPRRGWRGRVVMVCGPGGTGASTVAVAVAQGFARDVREARMVLLADLARRADQAMLHDATDIVPGIQELVDASRTATPPVEFVRSQAWGVEARGYDLLLGLRRPQAWATVRPRAFGVAFDALRRSYQVVVCDTDADVEGEETGSIDVQERNLMARTVASAAGAVLVVGQPGMKGCHSLVRTITELRDFGVSMDRIVPICNRSPRRARVRHEIDATLDALLRREDSGTGTGALEIVHVPEARVDAALRDGVAMPAAVCQQVMSATRRVLAATRSVPSPVPPGRVVPGSLGRWRPEPEAGTDEAAAG